MIRSSTSRCLGVGVRNREFRLLSRNSLSQSLIHDGYLRHAWIASFQPSGSESGSASGGGRFERFGPWLLAFFSASTTSAHVNLRSCRNLVALSAAAARSPSNELDNIPASFEKNSRSLAGRSCHLLITTASSMSWIRTG